jgi:hypothetical protein
MKRRPVESETPSGPPESAGAQFVGIIGGFAGLFLIWMFVWLVAWWATAWVMGEAHKWQEYLYGGGRNMGLVGLAALGLGLPMAYGSGLFSDARGGRAGRRRAFRSAALGAGGWGLMLTAAGTMFGMVLAGLNPEMKQLGAGAVFLGALVGVILGAVVGYIRALGVDLRK